MIMPSLMAKFLLCIKETLCDMNELKKVISLIKKTKKQPVLFHILHSHLAYLVYQKKTIPFEASDLWDKVLVASVEDPKIPRSSLETRLLQYLKGSRQKAENDEFKMKIVLYYMDSRFLSNMNMFILFELISHHYRVSHLTDMLIDSLLTQSFLSKNFRIKSSKRLAGDAVLLFLKNNNNFSYRRLPTYVYFDIEPPLVVYDSNSQLFQFKILESLSFYGNYTRNVDYFKSILPQTEDFLDTFKKFVCKDPGLLSDKISNFDIQKLQVINTNPMDNLKSRIRQAFDESSNKTELKMDIIEFLNSIEVGK